MRDRIRVLRVIEYTGERSAVEKHIKGTLHGEKATDTMIIRAGTLGEYPEVLDWPGDQENRLYKDAVILLNRIRDTFSTEAGLSRASQDVMCDLGAFLRLMEKVEGA